MNIKKNAKSETVKVTRKPGTSSLELFRTTGEELGLSTVVVKNTINKWWEVLAKHLRENGDFTFVGKAKFSLKKQRELVRSPSGQTMVKPKYETRVRIKPGSQFLREVNGISSDVKKKTKSVKKTPKK